MVISIVIVTYNTQKLLADCLSSIKKSGGLDLQDMEIIIVDNHSTDQTREYLKKVSFPNLKIILNEENLGFAKANNQGLKVAGGKYIMLLNSDTIIQDRALAKMVDFMETNLEIGGLSPLLLNADGSPQIDYYMRFPNLAQILGYHNRFLRPILMKTPLVGLICFPPQGRPYPVDQLPGAAMLARASTWQKVGFLDEDYPFYFEDVDWSWQAKKKGEKLLVLPTARITHLGGGTWKKGNKRPDKYYQQFFASMKIFVLKNYPPAKKRLIVGAIWLNLNLKSLVKKIATLLDC